MNALPSDPLTEFTPATQSELARFVAANAEGVKRPLYPVGGRTALAFGYPGPPGITVLTSRLNEVVEYPARDMTITVGAGIRIADLNALLQAEGQRLPVDIPQATRATLGGAVATNTSGPGRYGHGTLRDYVIGVSAVDARGRLFRAGGRVVKNVAGYDLCKLLIGSMGTLAIITQLTLKLWPQAETRRLLWATFDMVSEAEPIVHRLLTSDARPIAIEVLNRPAAGLIAGDARCTLPQGDGVLIVAVEGTEREVTWQSEVLLREIAAYGPHELVAVDPADCPALWQGLVEFQTPADAPAVFKANLLPSATLEFAETAHRLGVTLQAHAANGIVYGHLPDEAASLEPATEIITTLRQLARRSGGNLVLPDCPAGWKADLPVFGDPEPSRPLMRKLKQTLDPDNLLNPGRFHDGEQPAGEPSAATV